MENNNTSIELNIHQKLVLLRSGLEKFTKDKESYDYNYVSGSQVLSAIQDKMNELAILLIPNIDNVQNPIVDEYSTTKRDFRDWIVTGTMTYTFINADNPTDKIDIKWFFTGSQNDPSKSFGSALTYSERYFLMKFLGIPTDDADPDHKNNQKPQYAASKYKFGSPKDESIGWVSDKQVEEMIKYVKDGKKDAVITSLIKYKWSKANKEKIETELNK